MTIVRPNGMIIQVSSSGSEPSIGVAIRLSGRRRYLKEKKMITVQISVAKNALNPSRKKKSASTRPDRDEALSGKRGKSFHIAGFSSPPRAAEDRKSVV